MKLGFLYSGQGSQKSGMAYDFYKNDEDAKKFYDSLYLSERVKEISFFMDEENLKKTDNTQLAMVSFQIMVTELLKREKIEAQFLCGMSIGEYASLYASRVLSKDDAIKIAEYRGNLMQKVAEKNKTSMYAIFSSSEPEINDILEKYNSEESFVQISNINSQKQIVISGDSNLMKDVIKELEEKNRKVVELNVAGAFHTDYMKEVAKGLEEFFRNIEFKNPKKDIYLNYTGSKYQGEDLKEIMVNQVKSSVRFKDDIENMLADGVETFVEIGFNESLKKIVKKIDRKIEIISIATYDEFKEAVRSINGK